jgi:2-dehydro-3-deoxy-D-arabinonate dehydratase
MKIIQFVSQSGKPSLGAVIDNDVFDLTERNRSIFGSWTPMLESAKDRGTSVSELVLKYTQNSRKKHSYLDLWKKTPRSKSHLLLPLGPPEVWACGVTYLQSKRAREDETTVKGIYQGVYDAERPEIFLKGSTRSCVPHRGEVGIRSDSSWNIPEPELAFVLGLNQEIIGFTVGNDVSSRDIERMNPLYLPQAKIYNNSCALGPAVLLADGPDFGTFDVSLTIYRASSVVFMGSVNTSRMKRDLNELRTYLVRCNDVPPLTVCLTGTGIVPPDDFTLLPRDIVEITIDRIGTLVNTVGLIRA